MTDLPSPVTRTEEYLSAVAAELRGLRQDLGELLRVLRPVQLSPPIEGVVELTEPRRRKAGK